MIAGGGLWFNRQQRDRELETARQQREREVEIAERRTQDEALQAYLDQMSDMLIPNKDQPSLYKARPGDSLSSVARARTLTVLPRLDGNRKARVVQFLYESGLISKTQPILTLSGADLSGADLSEADLRGANMTEVNLREANLSAAILRRADLSGAILSEANLYYADLSEANLSEADLRGANMTEVNLREADLSLAILRGAELRKANMPWAQLWETDLYGANLSEADLRGAIVTRSTLQRANLSKANLSETMLGGSDLKEADLRGAVGHYRPDGQWTQWLQMLSSPPDLGPHEWDLELAISQFVPDFLLEGATMPNGQKYEDWLKDREKRQQDE